MLLVQRHTENRNLVWLRSTRQNYFGGVKLMILNFLSFWLLKEGVSGKKPRVKCYIYIYKSIMNGDCCPSESMVKSIQNARIDGAYMTFRKVSRVTL